jgi:hypothetical protein
MGWLIAILFFQHGHPDREPDRLGENVPLCYLTIPPYGLSDDI